MSIRPEWGEGSGIRVTRSVELDVQYESPTFPKHALLSGSGDSWDKRLSEELIQCSVHYN